MDTHEHGKVIIRLRSGNCEELSITSKSITTGSATMATKNAKLFCSEAQFDHALLYTRDVLTDELFFSFASALWFIKPTHGEMTIVIVL